ncbi:MAG TPA: hypothetical protein DCM32_05650 [Xanthomonadaceae bacterium]|jgi:hypothetical protein|nr:hypothetical protein [Xanthomonadaceae bacterium]
MAREILTDLDFINVSRLLNVPVPTLDGHAANKAYVDSAIEGLAWKDSARVSTQANISLASPGATIDSITMATNDRVLVRSQTTQTENGLYIWNGAAVAMTRSPDANTFPELEQAVVTVEEGTSAGATFRQTAVNGTIGSTNILWTSFGTSAPAASETTAGIIEIATQAETNAGTADNLALTPLKIANWAGRPLKFQQLVGDGTATQYTVTHNLGTRDVQASVYRNSGAFDEVIADIEYTTINSVTVRFASAPAINAFRVVIDG